MSHSGIGLTDAAWSLLHAIRLRGMQPNTDDDDTRRLLEYGYVAPKGKLLVLTDVGRKVHAEWARIPVGGDAEEASKKAYEQFLRLDQDVKQVVTDWQLDPGGSQGTGALGPDTWKLVDRLGAINGRLRPVLKQLTTAAPRFAGYSPRFQQALDQLEEGERRWFSGVTCDSYHTVWWALHEDLLLALGLERSEDPNQ